jgi:probable F420-dependent oxidoreductase
MGVRPFRFGVQTSGAPTAGAWRDLARRVEDLGYSSLQVSDHYFGPGAVQRATNHPPQLLAAVPAMAVAAEATSELIVGSGMACVDYHVPAVLAKELATLDLLSGGRIEVGLGAGWIAAEYEAMGLAFDPAPRRIQRLAEMIDLVKAHARDEELAVRGQEVTAAGYVGLPQPEQRPHPPIMVGGGARQVLRLAGRVADIVHLNFDNRSGVIGADGVRSSTAERTHEKVAWVREAAGDRWDDLELATTGYFVAVTDAPVNRAADVGQALGLDAEAMLSHVNALFGSVGDLCEQIERRRERHGISYWVVTERSFREFAPVVERLAGR